MSRQLHYPLNERLQDPVTERALQRVWRGIDDRSPRRPARRVRRTAIAVLAIVVGAVLALVLHARGDGPLRLADGRPVRAVDAAAESVIALRDGSQIRLWPGTRFEPTGSSASTFSAIVVRGEARFDVRPGGKRRWSIDCGPATIEVLGTEFHCRRSANRLRVSVERGTVLVRGDVVPNQARLLTAGDSLELADPAEPAPAR